MAKSWRMAYEKQHRASEFCAQQKRPKDNQPTLHWKIRTMNEKYLSK